MSKIGALSLLLLNVFSARESEMFGVIKSNRRLFGIAKDVATLACHMLDHQSSLVGASKGTAYCSNKAVFNHMSKYS